MAWSKAHNFQLSASLHQGALVANYPFDSCDTQVSDPAWHGFATALHKTNKTVHAMKVLMLHGLRMLHQSLMWNCLLPYMQAVVRYCPTLDDPLPLFLARSYASNHPIMRDNTNGTTKFVQGTVQGAQWYTLLGGMQVSKLSGRANGFKSLFPICKESLARLLLAPHMASSVGQAHCCFEQ